MKVKNKKIALAFPMGSRHIENIAFGVRQYSMSQNWKLLINPETHTLSIHDLQAGQVDGAIAMLRTPQDEAYAQSLGIPIINVSGALFESRLPRVCSDFYDVGKLAADHFIHRGFKNFAFYGLKNVYYSGQIRKAFEARVDCHVLEVSSGVDYQDQDDELLQFLRDLPKPCAVLAAHDPRALMVSEACEKLNIKVPEEVAILGSNNDQIICELANPPLSSIEKNDQEVGRLAAQSLDMLMRQEAVERQNLVGSIGVKTRQSSDVYQSAKPEMIAILDFIDANLCHTISVDIICRKAGRSRRWMEYAFRDEFQLSPKSYLDKVRLKKAKQKLIAEPQLNLSEVANACGFSSLDQMNQLFLKETGKRASFYRA